MPCAIVPLDVSHLDVIYTWMQQADLREHIGTVMPVNRERHQEWYRQQSMDSSRITMAIVRTEDGSHVGMIGLRSIDLIYRNAELWIYLGEPSSRGRGCAAESFDQLVSYAFETLGLHRIFVQVFSFNERALRFFKGRGMRPEGTLREAVFKRGRYWDKHVLGLLSTDSRERI